MELPGSDSDAAPDGATNGPTTKDWLRFALGAARRRRALSAAVFLGGVLAALATYRLSTPMYRVETRIMVRNQGFAGLGRGVTQDDAPTRAVFDLIHRRQNLLALLQHAGVSPDPRSAAAASGIAHRLSTGLERMLGGSATPEDPEDALVRRLDKALAVTAAEGTITVAIDWPSAEQAFKLVDGALQNFLEDRQVQEITMADEAISLLQPRVAAMREQLERVNAEVRRALAEGEASRRAARPGRLAVPGEPNEELIQLRVALESKERAIGDVEEIRRRRQTDLQTQLDAQRAVLSDAHPSIITLRQDLAALARDSPQIAQLREEARKIRRDYAARAAQDPRPRTAPAPAVDLPYRPTAGTVPAEESERVRQARFQYQQMIDRLNVATLERDAAGAAFKYRYVVSWPAEMPLNPASPSAARIFGLGIPGSVLLMLLVAAMLERRRGRIVERWQILRQLGLPILADQGRP
ncbi:MAG: lipopolysaccharide biosynthesis protein [Deltaproteobacteria bacterium]|nr:lipopolysaccharide biosynthesis protein [Deltaproteobacteria bacterium]